MPRLTRITGLALLVAIWLLMTLPSVAGATTQNGMVYWYRCTVHFNQDNSGLVSRRCFQYPMVREHRMPVSYWRRWTWVTTHTQVRVRYPRFVARAPSEGSSSVGCYRTTGYDKLGLTASYTTSHVLAGPGVLASNLFSFGTRITIPALGVSGVVWDHTDGKTDIDIWTTNPYAMTGCYKIIVG